MNKYIKWFVLILGLSLGACKPAPYAGNGGQKLIVTISSDGKLLAALDQAGDIKPRLRIKWLDKNEPWKEIPAPMYTGGIQFALKGYDLLLTHRLPDNLDVGQLTRWDVSNLAKESQTIHQGPWLAFPIEVKPNQYLIRTCSPRGMDMRQRDKNTCQTRGMGSYWILLTPGEPPKRVTSAEDVELVYSQPNVTDQGFFWMTEYPIGTAFYNLKKPLPHPELLSYPFPWGQAPKVAVSHLSPESDLVCDRQLARCLRLFLAGTDSKTHFTFIYDTEVMYRDQTCQPSGLQGYADKAAITPDGRFAAIPLANQASDVRRVVVLTFKDGQCEPTSINHIHFEEK